MATEDHPLDYDHLLKFYLPLAAEAHARCCDLCDVAGPSCGQAIVTLAVQMARAMQAHPEIEEL